MWFMAFSAISPTASASSSSHASPSLSSSYLHGTCYSVTRPDKGGKHSHNPREDNG
jgi:hypothetical protein